MDDIDAILAARELDQLVGMAESASLEAKSQPYDLTAPDGRFELAKDVSAFANSGGGHLIIGCRTDRQMDAQLDVITELVAQQENMLNPRGHLGVARELILPRIDGLTSDFVAVGDGPEGIVVLRIPPQDPDRKPFLVTQVIVEDARLKNTIVSYAERKGDQNEPMSPSALQAALRNGLDSTSERLSRMEEQLQTLVDALPEREASREPMPQPDVLEARVRDLLDDLE